MTDIRDTRAMNAQDGSKMEHTTGEFEWVAKAEANRYSEDHSLAGYAYASVANDCIDRLTAAHNADMRAVAKFGAESVNMLNRRIVELVKELEYVVAIGAEVMTFANNYGGGYAFDEFDDARFLIQKHTEATHEQ